MIQSITFWAVLLATVPIYWLLPAHYRMGFLALVSAAYLATLDAFSVGALLIWTVTFYALAPLAVDKARPARRLVTLLILLALGFLAYFKYIPPLLAALAEQSSLGALLLPLGISYYTFKLIHYAVEISRNNITDRSFSTFACYMFLFPIFTAGPIERFDHFLANKETAWRAVSALEGTHRIAVGLIKQFVIADYVIREALRVAHIPEVDGLVANLAHISPIKVWLFLIFTYLYTYISFSAYTDIAIGASRLYGLHIMENFNFPILASNFANFWKRWHMTLAGWCQAYVYLPTIGLSRNPYMAVIATFVAMGLWHAGALNWIFWGLYNAVGVMVYQRWARLERQRGWTFMKKGPARHLGIPITFLYFSGSFAFTATHGHGDLAAAGNILLRLFAIGPVF